MHIAVVSHHRLPVTGLNHVLADPNIIAHGHYVTTDLGIAGAIFFAIISLVRFLRKPDTKNTILFGVVLGIAPWNAPIILGVLPRGAKAGTMFHEILEHRWYLSEDASRGVGLDVVRAYMGHVQDNAEESVRRVITRLQDGQFTLPLDNGAQIQVAVRVNAAERSAEIDFSGTSAQLANNFNAPRAVCMAAVLYVFRTLVDDDIPLNAGCLKPLKVIIPEGSMLNPLPPASVVAGNVETSSCITNALFGALGVMAGSQPTMNNFTFGNARYQYYETVSGGSGAGGRFDARGALVGGFDGTSVVQTHMTNSRLTDPEVLEFRFPVRLESYAIRQGSGGQGRWKGGDGGVRRIRFLEPMTAGILSNGRVHPAFGASGGQPGQPGINRVVRARGQTEALGHIGQTEMAEGDIFEIHTPGGGGFGKA